jgi:hypothetical protein
MLTYLGEYIINFWLLLAHSPLHNYLQISAGEEI